MPAAARVFDFTNHGGIILGPGTPNVLIGGKPAAHILDIHLCAIPPISGHYPVTLFVMGSSSVMIGGLPALRTGDLCLCLASPAVGEPTVQIGG